MNHSEYQQLLGSLVNSSTYLHDDRMTLLKPGWPAALI